jgi:hypothetical protein
MTALGEKMGQKLAQMSSLSDRSALRRIFGKKRLRVQ